ncbi:AMP-binding protein [Flavobacterium enshiense]|uniref:O-succinylbenzoic acid--CoA ligase n=1 Tax=Flavobacterium enshiense DK69 TaxID=1107311 RepID=A0A0A2MZA8_9FLAO|nr:AMP-binding protein [Flavobacterium enshiense]KGO96768.1 O-succinylbenzoic acid--CoA ligase [Flavobacterium enshiense DK69]
MDRFLKIHSDFKFNGKQYDSIGFYSFAKEITNSEEEFERHLSKFVLEWFDENNYVEVTTSGTTGTSKIIRLKKEAMVNSALATAAFFDLKSNCKALHCLPMQYIAGKMMLVRAMVLGWDLDFVKPDSRPLDGNEKNYDFAAMVPLQVENSIEQLHLVKKVIIGGAKLNPDLSNKLKQLPADFYETYGMTETITHIAAKRIQDTAFSVLPGIVISTDERNCLVIDAPRLSDIKIVTNDVVELQDGSKFVWLGRFDNVINSGGVKLFPERIEEKLGRKIPYRFFVIGKPDTSLGEKLVLVIESSPYELETSLFDDLGKFEKPKEILFVPKFSETETGKIKRAETIK